MLATFHYCLDDGQRHALDCDSNQEIASHVFASRCGIEEGTERWFYIEWHAREGA